MSTNLEALHGSGTYLCLCALSCMRTGIKGSRTATSCLGRTVWWWCGMTTAAGATFPATITWLTPARKAPVSTTTQQHWVEWHTDSFYKLLRLFIPASCGPPPKVRNAFIFGKVKQRYATDAAVRYYCAEGFRQRLNPLIRCLSGGKWERPQIQCIPGKMSCLLKSS